MEDTEDTEDIMDMEDGEDIMDMEDTEDNEDTDTDIGENRLYWSLLIHTYLQTVCSKY